MTSIEPTPRRDVATPSGVPHDHEPAEADHSRPTQLNQNPVFCELSEDSGRPAAFGLSTSGDTDAAQQLAGFGYSLEQIRVIQSSPEDQRRLHAVVNAHKMMLAAYAEKELHTLRQRLTNIARKKDGLEVLLAISRQWAYLEDFGYTGKQLRDVFVPRGVSGLTKLYRIQKDLEDFGYTDGQLKEVLMRGGPPGLASLRLAHIEMAPAFAKSELPARRRKLVEMVCGIDGPNELTMIASDWSNLKHFGYTAEELDRVVTCNGQPGLRGLRRANDRMSAGLRPENANRIRKRLLEIACEHDGVGTLRAIYWKCEILRRNLSAEDILDLAGQPNGAKLLNVVELGIELGVFRNEDFAAVRTKLIELAEGDDGADVLDAIREYWNAWPADPQVGETLELAGQQDGAALLRTKTDAIRAAGETGSVQ